MITLSTGTLFPYGLNRIFAIAKMAGFDGLELIPRPMNFNEFKDSCFWDFWDVPYIQSLEKEFNIKISSIHTQPHFEEDPNAHWKRTAELAIELNVPNVICHIPYNDQVVYERWFWDYCIKDRHYPFTMLAENLLHLIKGKQMTYEPVEWQEFPALCFDVNHALASNQNVLDLLKLFDNIKEFHISNYASHEHQNILTNKETFKEIFAAKKVANYCVEMYYDAFKNYQDQNEVISELKEIKEFIEKCTR